MDASGGRCLALPITFRKRSARERGRDFGLPGLAFLAADFRTFARRTSTSVPSGKARGFSSSTLPFLTLPRTVMLNLHALDGNRPRPLCPSRSCHARGADAGNGVYV